MKLFLVAALAIASTLAEEKWFNPLKPNHGLGNIIDAIDKSVQHTTRFLENVAENIERSFDGSNVNELRLFGRQDDLQPDDEKPIEDISGTLGDENLKVYYEGEDEPESVQASNPIGSHPFGFNFGASLFKPFHEMRPGSSNIFNFLQRTPWWDGPNVCVDREEIDEKDEESPAEENSMPTFGQFSMSSCRELKDKYTCTTKMTQRGVTKSVTVTYRCCHGFVQDNLGCMKVELSDMPKTIDGVDGSDFLTLIKAAGLEDMLTKKNLTIFVPTDEAIAEYTQELEEMNEMQNNINEYRSLNPSSSRSHSITPALLSHMVEGFIYAAQMVDEEVLQSENPESTIRINTYSIYPPTVTVNCARLVTANQHSTTGVVHSIDRVLSPVTQSVGQILASNERFSIFAELLIKSQLMDGIESGTQQTIFAPTNEAFKNLPNGTIESLLDGSSCREDILLSHLLPNTICSAAIQDDARTMNHFNRYLHVKRDENDDIFVARRKIIEKDIVANNGVIHVIDGVLIPREAKPATEILEHHNLTKFMDLLEYAGMIEDLNAMNGVTIFAPTNKAFEKVQSEIDALKEDKSLLRELLAYHITTSPMPSHDMRNNHVANTQAEYPLRINIQTRVPLIADIMRRSKRTPFLLMAGCSRVSVGDSHGCGVIVHLLDDILKIPADSVYKQLQIEEELTMFYEMVKNLNMEKELSLAGPYTILAPTNKALKALPQEELDEILANRQLQEKLVKKHILYEHVCCSGVNHNSWLFMDRKRAVDSSLVHVRKSPNGKIMVGSAKIVKCGSPAENGVIHSVNGLVDDISTDHTKLTPSERRHSVPRWMKLFGF